MVEQPTLLDDQPVPTGPDELLLGNDFTDVRHVDLDDHSWVEVVPGLIRNPDRLYEALRADLDWSQRKRWMYDRKVAEPRLTANYPDVTTVPSRTLRQLTARLARAYHVPYDGLWVNQYRNERDSTSWHGDKISCSGATATVPVLTLGHPRRFLIKPRAGGASTPFTPGNGDLLVMGGRCQVDWLHSIPKQTRPAGGRISVNFQSSAQARRGGR